MKKETKKQTKLFWVHGLNWATGTMLPKNFTLFLRTRLHSGSSLLPHLPFTFGGDKYDSTLFVVCLRPT